MTLRAYVEAVFGRWDETLTRGRFQPELSQIVQCDGQDIGLLVVVREPTHIRLLQVFIGVGYQRRGIGTAILRALKAEARQASLPIRLHVLTSNPAFRLYEREGFVVTARAPEHIYMEWNSSGA